ncbi:MAG: Asp-tRNA(Asn)/Glu-tRNA(Gln) amidotransferase subunit GatA, partial [Eubacterium sp.]|nr:Asp-tRNA(Asn)/Glu-tRNA(Gln) amidotransferase subunit GatA [Eubacterium sp.]
MEIYEMTALEVAEKIRNKEFTAMDAVESVAKAVEEKDKTYNCYTHLDKELALEKAEQAQKRIESGEADSVLAGVPVAIKDNICTKGDITSCSSKILYNFKPPYDATVIKKLDAAGIVPCGKVNMDEFAMGSTTETSFYGATKNPWDISRVQCGSSGGAAAAVD